MTCFQFVLIGVVLILYIRFVLVFNTRKKCLQIIIDKGNNEKLFEKYKEAPNTEYMIMDLTRWTFEDFFPGFLEKSDKIQT